VELVEVTPEADKSKPTEEAKPAATQPVQKTEAAPA
jgi:hypothetical protein